MPVTTRWFSLYNSLNNLQASKYVIMQLVDQEYQTLKEINPKTTSALTIATIKSSDFWEKLAKVIKDIELPAKIIGKLEKYDAPLSLVYYYFV